MADDVLVLGAGEIGSGWRLPDTARAAIIVGDSVHAVLPMLAPGSIDGTVTDPPYSSGGAFRGDRAGSTAVKYIHNNETNVAWQLPDFFGDTRDGLAHLFWLQTALALAWASMREGAFCAMFTDWRQLAAAILAIQGANFTFRGVRPWLKPPGAYRVFYEFPHQDCEFLVWGIRGAAQIRDDFEVSPPSPWMHKAPRGGEKRHQTEKPLQVMRDLVRVVPRGGVILDPFAGSGTTLEAALIEGRRAVGVELSPDYAQVIAERLNAVQTPVAAAEQPSLFGGADGR